MSLMFSLNRTEMHIINDIINNINGQISFKGIPKTKAKPFQEQLCQKWTIKIPN